MPGEPRKLANPAFGRSLCPGDRFNIGFTKQYREY